MNRHLLIAFSIVAILACGRVPTAKAGGHGAGHGAGRGGFTSRSGSFNRGFGGGFGLGGGYDCCDFAELYRQLYNNLPYFALHPPVYYSEPVPRTYGYSPFAYPPGVMTPEVCGPQPVTINNPYVPSASPAGTQKSVNSDRSAATSFPIQPLVVDNPYVTQGSAVAQSEQ
ncbi:MAG TPA: hypothetical protein VH107_18520 [Lacipirellulaceae bacterium]|jgi:hypothetical protein|nr:hypothetical protein [Lacipirellulaceae bacterium]